MTTANRFEDRLLEQLRGVVAARPVPDIVRRQPRRGRVVLAGAGLAAASVAVAIIATGNDASPAYALEKRADGSVTVKIHSLRDAAGLQRSLRAAGLPAVVDYTATACAQPGFDSGPPSQRQSGSSVSGVARESGPATSSNGVHRNRASTSVRIASDGVTFTIDPGNIKPGEKIYITTSTGAVSSLAMAIARERSATPCAPGA